MDHRDLDRLFSLVDSGVDMPTWSTIANLQRIHTLRQVHQWLHNFAQIHPLPSDQIRIGRGGSLDMAANELGAMLEIPFVGGS